MSEEIQKLIEQVSDKIDVVQKKNTALETKYDGLTSEVIKGLEAQIEKGVKEAQELKLSNDATEKRLDETIAQLARPGNGKSAGEENVIGEEYKSALREYYRKRSYLKNIGNRFQPRRWIFSFT